MTSLEIDLVSALFAVTGSGDELACAKNIKHGETKIGEIVNGIANKACHQSACLWTLHRKRRYVRLLDLHIELHATGKTLGP